MLVFTFPTISEKMDIMLSDDCDYILTKLTKIKQQRIKKLMVQENDAGILEINDIILKLKYARMNPIPQIMKKM
tara:strand:+ start:376 stop:597 length:222 start_codon:yes stop_codon:yes gene_type:complete